MFVEIVCKIDDLNKFYVQFGKCVKFWVLVSNRTENAEVLRFSTSKVWDMQVELKDHVGMKDWAE